MASDNVTNQESGDKGTRESKDPVFSIGIDDPLAYEAFHPAGPGDANKSPSPFRVAGQVIEDAVQGAANTVIGEAKNHPGRFALEAGGAIALGVAATAGSPIIAGGAAFVGVSEAAVAGAATVGTAIEGLAATTLGIGTIGGGVAAVNDIKDGLNKSQKDIEIVTNPEKHTPQEIAQANKNIETNLGPAALQAMLTAGGAIVAGGNAARLLGKVSIAKGLTVEIGNVASPKLEAIPPGTKNEEVPISGADDSPGETSLQSAREERLLEPEQRTKFEWRDFANPDKTELLEPKNSEGVNQDRGVKYQFMSLGGRHASAPNAVIAHGTVDGKEFVFRAKESEWEMRMRDDWEHPVAKGTYKEPFGHDVLDLRHARELISYGIERHRQSARPELRLELPEGSDEDGFRYRFLSDAATIQAEGIVDDHDFFFHARGNQWRFSVSHDPSIHPLAITEPSEFGFTIRDIHEETPGKTEPDEFAAGWMDLEYVRKLIANCVKQYRETTMK